jgi:site-specific DNA recombinase
MSKRAINLARVSTPKQAELYSLDYQLDQERIYCNEVGLVVVKEFKDDVSGRKLDRDGLEEACRMLEADEADVLVTWKFDRLHRNYVNSVLLRDRIRRAGKEIHYAQTRQISGKTARERLPEDLQFIMAEIDADDIAERTNTGKRNKIEKGGKWLGLNRPPYGYSKKGRGKDSELLIDEDTARNVRMIFDWYVNEGMSTQDISDKLTALGVPTPEDVLPNRTRKKRGYGEWSSSTISKLLREYTYSGVFYHYRYRRVNNRVEKVTDQSQWRGVPVPRIVDQDTFHAAQAKLTAGRRLSRRATKYEYLVGRRIKCACGYTMRSSTSSRMNEAKQYTYFKYRCLGRDKFVVGNCDMPSLDTAEVDARVWEWVKNDIGNPIVLERKLREIQTQQSEENKGKEEALATLYAHKEEIEEELKRLARIYGHTDMPKRIIDGLIGEENHKLQLTEAEIRKTEDELKTPLTDDIISSLLGFSIDFQAHLEAVEESFIKRRVVIDGLDTRVEVFRKDTAIWLRIRTILSPKGKELPLKDSSSLERTSAYYR